MWMAVSALVLAGASPAMADTKECGPALSQSNLGGCQTQPLSATKVSPQRIYYAGKVEKANGKSGQAYAKLEVFHKKAPHLFVASFGFGGKISGSYVTHMSGQNYQVRVFNNDPWEPVLVSAKISKGRTSY